jgi:F-type H+-transporting ATPase subunit delta
MADHSTVARPYAKALFEAASAARDLAGWSTALAAAAGVVRDAAAHRYLGRPELDAAARADFVGKICASMEGAALLSSGLGRNLLRLLAENDRLNALPEISAQFDRLKTRAENKVRVKVTSASAIDDAQATKISAALQKTLGRQVDLELEVDPALLGGAIVRAEDRVIDGSVRSRLKRLAETLID